MNRKVLLTFLILVAILWVLPGSAQVYRLSGIDLENYSNYSGYWNRFLCTLHYDSANPVLIDSMVVNSRYAWEVEWTLQTIPCTSLTQAGMYGGLEYIYSFSNGEDEFDTYCEVETDSFGRVPRYLENGGWPVYSDFEVTRYYASASANRPDSLAYKSTNQTYLFFFTYDTLGRISDATVHYYNWQSLNSITDYHVNYGAALPFPLKLTHGYNRFATNNMSIVYCFLLDPNYQILSIDNLTGSSGEPGDYHSCSISSGLEEGVWTTGIGASSYESFSSWSVGFDGSGQLKTNTRGSSFEGNGSSEKALYHWESVPSSNQDENVIPDLVKARVIPNPSRSSFQIEFNAIVKESALMRIFNIRGQLVRSVQVLPGTDFCSWDGLLHNGRSAPSGLYIFSLDSAGLSIHTKAMLLRD